MADKVTDFYGSLGLDFESLSKRYKSRNAALENKMATALPTWIDIRDFLGPRTARFKGEQVNQYTRQDSKIINTNPLYAVRALPAGLQSGVTSPMRPWFRTGLADPDLQEFKPVKEWLSLVDRVLRDIFARSNIYDRLQANYMTLGLYGTGAMGIEEDNQTILRAKDFPIGSFKIATDETSRVNTMIRDFTMTAENMVAKFKDRAPELAKLAYANGNYDQEFAVCQIIEPNRIFQRGNRMAARRKYASVFYDPTGEGEKAILGYSGSDYFQVLTPRWDILGENDYGFGCGELGLGDGKQVQILEKRKLQMLDKNANPTMVADASLRNTRTNNLPGGTVYVSGLITGKEGYKPAYVPNPYLNEMREEIMRVEGHIDEAFFKNLFLQVSEIADQPNITATQINALREEKLMMLGPVLGRINTEQNDPLIDIAFDTAWNRGMIPPPPEEIQGMPLKVEYISILAQAQKAIGIGNIERMVNFIGGLAKVSGDSSVFDKLNKYQAIDEYAEGSGTPPSIINDDEEADKIAQSRNQQMAAATAVQAGQGAADIAKTMADTDMGGDNALVRTMQNLGAAT